MYIQNRNRITDTENKRVVGRQREKLRVWIKRYKLLCIKQIHNKDKLCSTGSYSHYLVINFNGV